MGKLYTYDHSNHSGETNRRRIWKRKHENERKLKLIEAEKIFIENKKEYYNLRII
jgi:hypothetical protein